MFDHLQILMQKYPLFGYAFKAFNGFIFLLLVFAPLEKLFSISKQKIFRKNFLTDALFYAISFLPTLLLSLPLLGLAWLVKSVVPMSFLSWVDSLAWHYQLLASFVIGEIGYYWGHRWAHSIPFLWKFHAVHHNPEELDWLVNTRMHPLDVVFIRGCSLLPLVIVGLIDPTKTTGPDTTMMAVLFVYSLWAYFVHANIKWRFGWLEYLFATPHFHHWHHYHTGGDKQYIHKNFAGIFPWLDQMFGTLIRPKHYPDRYGVSLPNYKAGFIQQLFYPLITKIQKRRKK